MCVVFFIDDDVIQHFIVRKVIEKAGVFKKVLCFERAFPVVQHLAAYSDDTDQLPDVILLDLNLPELDGWDFLEMFKELYHSLSKKVFIYILTASVMNRDKSRASAYPFVKGFISKPITITQITSINQDIAIKN